MQQYSCATVTSFSRILTWKCDFYLPKTQKDADFVSYVRFVCNWWTACIWTQQLDAAALCQHWYKVHHCTFIIKSCFSTFIFLAYLNFLPLQKKKAHFSTYYAGRGSRVVSKLGCSNCQSACGCRPALSPGPLHFSPLVLSVERMFIKAHGA